MSLTSTWMKGTVPVASPLAIGQGWYAKSFIALLTLALVTGLARVGQDRTLETVERETPARSATSFTVALPGFSSLLGMT